MLPFKLLLSYILTKGQSRVDPKAKQTQEHGTTMYLPLQPSLALHQPPPGFLASSSRQGLLLKLIRKKRKKKKKDGVSALS